MDSRIVQCLASVLKVEKLYYKNIIVTFGHRFDVYEAIVRYPSFIWSWQWFNDGPLWPSWFSPLPSSSDKCWEAKQTGQFTASLGGHHFSSVPTKSWTNWKLDFFKQREKCEIYFLFRFYHESRGCFLTFIEIRFFVFYLLLKMKNLNLEVWQNVWPTNIHVFCGSGCQKTPTFCPFWHLLPP